MNWLKVFADKILSLENAILKSRLDKLESQFGEPYMKGFSHGLEMALKLMPELTERSARIVRDKAIQDTLERLSGNNKKTH